MRPDRNTAEHIFWGVIAVLLWGGATALFLHAWMVMQ